jgi:hypothetical protein
VREAGTRRRGRGGGCERGSTKVLGPIPLAGAAAGDVAAYSNDTFQARGSSGNMEIRGSMVSGEFFEALEASAGLPDSDSHFHNQHVTLGKCPR